MSPASTWSTSSATSASTPWPGPTPAPGSPASTSPRRPSRRPRDLAGRAGLDDRADLRVRQCLRRRRDALRPRTFDIVYVSLGPCVWLPSVDRWADQVAALARPGGRLYLHDVHPLAWSLAYETPTFAHTYFEEPEPYVDDSDETYTDADRATGQHPHLRVEPQHR